MFGSNIETNIFVITYPPMNGKDSILLLMVL